MKSITFTSEERTLLQIFLKQRLDYYNQSIEHNPSIDKAGNKRFKTFYLEPLLSALNKISKYDTEIYDRKEKLSFISCINEHIDDIRNQLQLPENYKEELISDEQIKLAFKIDTCKDILSKCGYYKKHETKTYNTEFRYRNILNFKIKP